MIKLPKNNINDVTWRFSSNIAVNQSVFSLKETAYDWGGRQLELTVTISNMSLDNAKIWQAFFLSLDNRLNSFSASLPVDAKSEGRATDDLPVILSGGQTGTSLNIGGISPNTISLFVAGDWISINDNLFKLLGDVESNSDGECWLSLYPAIETAFEEDTPIEVRKPTGIFRVVAPPTFAQGLDIFQPGFTFSATEQRTN